MKTNPLERCSSFLQAFPSQAVEYRSETNHSWPPRAILGERAREGRARWTSKAGFGNAGVALCEVKEFTKPGHVESIFCQYLPLDMTFYP